MPSASPLTSRERRDLVRNIHYLFIFLSNAILFTELEQTSFMLIVNFAGAIDVEVTQI